MSLAEGRGRQLELRRCPTPAAACPESIVWGPVCPGCHNPSAPIEPLPAARPPRGPLGAPRRPLKLEDVTEVYYEPIRRPRTK